MIIEILNVLTESDGMWSYTGQFRINGQWISMSGKIEKIESMPRLKDTLKDNITKYIEDYIEENATPETLTMPVNGTVVATLST